MTRTTKNAIKITLIIAAAIALLMLMDHAYAAGSKSDDVIWTQPTTRVDGTPLTLAEIQNYEMEIWRDGAVIQTLQFPPDQFATNVPRELPPNYELCYVMRTYALTPPEPSDWSLMVCKEVKARPNPPPIQDVK